MRYFPKAMPSEKRTPQRSRSFAPQRSTARTARKVPRGLDRAGGKWGDVVRARLQRLRAGEGLSKAAFARRCDVDAPRISEWWSGRALPSAESLQKIAVAFDISLDWLLCGTGGDEPTRRGQWRAPASLEADVVAAAVREAGIANKADVGRGAIDGSALIARMSVRLASDRRRWLAWERRVQHHIEWIAIKLETTLTYLDSTFDSHYPVAATDPRPFGRFFAGGMRDHCTRLLSRFSPASPHGVPRTRYFRLRYVQLLGTDTPFMIEIPQDAELPVETARAIVGVVYQYAHHQLYNTRVLDDWLPRGDSTDAPPPGWTWPDLREFVAGWHHPSQIITSQFAPVPPHHGHLTVAPATAR